MQNNDSFLTLTDHPCMITRLLDEIREASRQFREDPKTFFRGPTTVDAAGTQRRRMLLQFGLAIGLLFYAVAFAAILIVWSIHKPPQENQKPFVILYPPPLYVPQARMREDDEQSGGGGGGGRHTPEPASRGSLSPFVYSDPIIAPRPEETIRPPVLPVIETVKVDPRILVERDNLMLTGLPDGAVVPPSAGPGSDGGIGTGSRGGIGPGAGIGVGPGNDENIGGRYPGIGGLRRPGTSQESVDRRPVLLNQPQPLYTEQARTNKVQGVVRVKVLVDANGSVKEVVVVRGLPDGLNEQAIRAAYQMRFRPAVKNGQPVSYWLNVEVEFNLR
ncbi:MAG TPA: energy transducer TonB [Blastocatellia bacterium]|nr:energy transducer TonB [Blastocatellia bacterium]